MRAALLFFICFSSTLAADSVLCSWGGCGIFNPLKQKATSWTPALVGENPRFTTQRNATSYEEVTCSDAACKNSVSRVVSKQSSILFSVSEKNKQWSVTQDDFFNPPAYFVRNPNNQNSYLYRPSRTRDLVPVALASLRESAALLFRIPGQPTAQLVLYNIYPAVTQFNVNVSAGETYEIVGANSGDSDRAIWVVRVGRGVHVARCAEPRCLGGVKVTQVHYFGNGSQPQAGSVSITLVKNHPVIGLHANNAFATVICHDEMCKSSSINRLRGAVNHGAVGRDSTGRLFVAVLSAGNLLLTRCNDSFCARNVIQRVSLPANQTITRVQTIPNDNEVHVAVSSPSTGYFAVYTSCGPTVTSVEPSIVDIRKGAQTVIVEGSGFCPTISTCELGAKSYRGKYLSPTSFSCTIPANAPLGSYVLIVPTARGTPVSFANITIIRAADPPTGNGTIEGVVLSAKNDKPLRGATVAIMSANVSLSVRTDARGAYRFIDLPYPGNYTVTAAAADFDSATYVLPLTNTSLRFNIALSPIIKDLGSLRWVLLWFQEPRVLAARLNIDGNCTISKLRRNSTHCAAGNATLEETADNGFGPETIFMQQSGNHTLDYSVYWVKGGRNWQTSGATVHLYDKSGKIASYKPAASQYYAQWDVMSVTAEGSIKVSDDTVAI